MNKKGQQYSLDNIMPIILTFIVIGMVMGAGAIALNSFRDTSTRNIAGRTTNITAVNATAVSFAQGDEISCTIESVLNSTSQAVASTKYTYSATACTFTLADNSQTSTNHKITYTANINKDAASMLNLTSRGLNNMSDQLPAVGVMIGIGLILAVVIGVFMFFAMGKI